MFQQIKLPYALDALEPFIDKETMSYHYEKHHKTYTDKFNELVKKAPQLEGKSAEDILMHLDKAPAELREGLRNFGGGYYNHNLYFESLTALEKKPSGQLEKMINESFGSLKVMLEELSKAAGVKLFGSGYAWLILRNGKLAVTISANQDSPLMQGNPNLLLPLDMWEHAYYLKHKNAKNNYIDTFCKIIDWDMVAARLEKARIRAAA